MSAEVDLTDIRILELPTIDLSGGVDLGLDLDNIRIRELAPFSIGITDLPVVELNANLTSNSFESEDGEISRLASYASLDSDLPVPAVH